MPSRALVGDEGVPADLAIGLRAPARRAPEIMAGVTNGLVRASGSVEVDHVVGDRGAGEADVAEAGRGAVVEARRSGQRLGV